MAKVRPFMGKEEYNAVINAMTLQELRDELQEALEAVVSEEGQKGWYRYHIDRFIQTAEGTFS